MEDNDLIELIEVPISVGLYSLKINGELRGSIKITVQPFEVLLKYRTTSGEKIYGTLSIGFLSDFDSFGKAIREFLSNAGE